MIFWLNVLSIGAAAWYVWLHTFAPLWGTQSLYTVLMRVSALAAFAFAASILNAVCAYVVLTRAGLGKRSRMRWKTGAWFWYAPALLLATSFSPMPLAGSLILLVSVTRALALTWTPTEPDRIVVAPTPTRILIWRAAIAVAASLAIHVAISFLLQKQPLLAAGLLTTSVTALTGLCIATGAVALPRPGRGIPSPMLGALLTFLLASGITVIRVAGLGGGDGAGRGGGGGDGVAAKGNIRGVILTTDVLQESLVVAPQTAAVRAAASRKDRDIPFSGEYWIYRVPFQRPPDGSLRQPGNPFDLSFSTTDMAKITLEARQKLEEPMTFDCCRALRVKYRTREVRPGALLLEARLMEPLGFSIIYLGTSELKNGEHTAEFLFPVQSRVAQFQQLVFRFHDHAFYSRNPKVQIKSFAFVSR